jgi:hypothetical protein
MRCYVSPITSSAPNAAPAASAGEPDTARSQDAAASFEGMLFASARRPRRRLDGRRGERDRAGFTRHVLPTSADARRDAEGRPYVVTGTERDAAIVQLFPLVKTIAQTVRAELRAVDVDDQQAV